MTSEELRFKLTSILAIRRNWNHFIPIAGRKFIYNSARNEIRMLHDQPSGQILRLIGYFTLHGDANPMGALIWCTDTEILMKELNAA